MRIPPIVFVIAILILFPRRLVAEKVGYLAMRCILAVAVLVPILWALLRYGNKKQTIIQNHYLFDTSPNTERLPISASPLHT
jgi:hypothetical protein